MADPQTTITNITLSYTIVGYNGLDSSLASVQSTVSELIRKSCDGLMQTFKCQISISLAEPHFDRALGQYEFIFTISITGSMSQIISCRSHLLRNNPTQVRMHSITIFNKLDHDYPQSM